ncbi:hypothetical protein F5888DRAFT_1129431 [Russula emetica]|nr:hypothetical protein F5888DRAFT_1129431 [Russula emetica]
MTELWCYIQGERDYFRVSISPNHTINDLKKQIYDEQLVQFIVQCSPSDLTLTKVDIDLDAVENKMMRGEYRPDANDQPQPLRTVKTTISSISEVWPEPPPHGHLHVFVGLPGGAGSPTFVNRGGECFIRLFALARIYGDGQWTPVPDFVLKFERDLHGKPGVAPDVCCFLDYSFDADGST